MKRIALTLGVLALLCLPSTGKAEEKPVQIGLFEPVQIFPASTSVKGVRISLNYGVNQDLTGFDWGLVNRLHGDMTGVQWGFVNLVDGDSYGWQDAFVNITGGRASGLQLGFFNKAGQVHGIQFGIWNQAGTLEGLQIGLLNFNESGNPHGFLPIVNYSFK